MNEEQLLIEWNDKILDFLLQYRKEHPGFKFWLRSRESTRSDDQGRLSKGIWFQGSDYIFISFHNGSGGTNMTRSIGWVVTFDDEGDPHYYIEIVWPQETNQTLINAYKEIINRLGGFKKVNDLKYTKGLPDKDLFDALTDYIEQILPVINDCLESQNATALMTIPDEKFDRQLNKILELRSRLKSTPTFKNNQQSMPSHHLNTILYGPPGTGKTYHTILKAAEIINGGSFINRYEESKKIYEDARKAGQAEFITFHQNYSYEDFVAGLRPDVAADTNGLKFKEHRGIFYKLCERAKKNYLDYRQFKEGKEYKDPTFEEVLAEFLKPLTENDEPIQLSTVARNKSFKIDSLNAKNLGFEKQSGSREHTLSINTLKGLYEGNREYDLQGLGVYMYPVVDKLKQIAATIKKPVTEVNLKNYVLIIDEINRANISRVFGELITLLEADKRIGAKHELLLSLPGLPDDEAFGVPPNLYIIGTMNTADKSIALVDIALRRRFRFEPMYPNSKIDGVLYPEILDKLNEQILAKKGADFLMGHSYFMNDEHGSFNLADAMNYKVIPLLNEYFYNQRGDVVKTIIESAIGGTAMRIEKDMYGQLQFFDTP